MRLSAWRRSKLTVVSENEAARRLYRTLGFIEYGLERRALKQNGRYYDEVLMVKFLDQNLDQNTYGHLEK